MVKTKVTTTVKENAKPKKKACPKEPIQICYSVKEDAEMELRNQTYNLFDDYYGLHELARSVKSKADSKNIEKEIGRFLDIFKANYVGVGDTEPLGAFHASLQNIAIEPSRSERKGLRATLVVKIENYKFDSKDTWVEYRNICPCECLAELLSDLASEIADACYEKVRHKANIYNEKLEKEKDGCKCKGCKCSKS